MSILKRPYEISVWDDVWNGIDKFEEVRLGIIGTNTMEAQCRVLEPTLARNTNGTKKLTFKLYKKYKDNVTGEEVQNPFYDWLVSERKIKLKYDDEWHDFIIKNIVEDSSNYLYQYQLEDALVQELSKNGFGVVFDASQNNNLGTARELAEKTLQDTDWTLSDESEVLVQRIDEALVYLTVNSEIDVKQLIDQKKNNLKSGVTEIPTKISAGTTILAAYSSCTNKPHRFQFFYVSGMVSNGTLTNILKKDDNRNILNEDCQYYKDYDDPDTAYILDTNSGLFLPQGFSTTTVAEEAGAIGVTISNAYRGKRYGFTQQTKYIAEIDKYVNIYDKNGIEYYGYQHNEYVSPTLIQNIISNTQFESTAGWTGTRKVPAGGVSQKAIIENVYGRFENNTFISTIDDMRNGIFPHTITDANNNKIIDYEPYLRFCFPDTDAVVINSGPYDNRISIGNMEQGEEWHFDCEVLNNDGTPTSNLNFSLGEYEYEPKSDYYKQVSNSKITFDNTQTQNNKFIVNSNSYSKEEFKKNSRVYLLITTNRINSLTPDNKPASYYYIKTINLYKSIYKDDGTGTGNKILITPENQAARIETGVIDTTYYYFLPDKIKNITSIDQLQPDEVTKTLTYGTYKPKYNNGAEKIRSITAKESNYFNILQSIAETFEAWLKLIVSRDPVTGAITSKQIAFKNYIGDNNYAGFRYGVNLKSIKRTYESKNLVTKLIVKQNSNEYAKNGFCTIARANANPTGENYIYDFQYFFNRGLLNARDYIETVYVINSQSSGGDIDISHTSYTLQGYFPRINKLNNLIEADNEILLNLSKDLTDLKANLEVATVGLEAAISGAENAQEKFEKLSGLQASLVNKPVLSSDLMEREEIIKVLQEFSTFYATQIQYASDKARLELKVTELQTKYNDLAQKIEKNKEHKKALNQLFFSTYGRFIQEGTWISEEYLDDEKYYADAQSVMYNSCFPKATYDIGVIEISKLPGYEDFTYDLGDTTFVEDNDFFGGNYRVEVVVTETSENLDDPTKNSIKIQNFKNQFQDLFQKITATVQQTQYSTGSYQKAVALAEANQARKQQFFTDALNGASSKLAVAGQQTVTMDNSGLTIQSANQPSNSIKMIGGAILLSKQDANGQQKWTTGVTADGISADLITTGILHAGEICIMNANDPLFRWDSFGISAFDNVIINNSGQATVSGVNFKKFVRFDKYGIYGIKDGVDGTNWVPRDIAEIDEKATFALTWDGLKVTGTGGTAHIGKHNDAIIRVTNGTNDTFIVDNSGNVTIRGNLMIGNGTSVSTLVNSKMSATVNGNYSWDFNTTSGIYMYRGKSNNGTKLFSIDDNGLIMNGSGTFSGEITATSGYIGGWDISELGITKNNLSQNIGAGMLSDSSNIVFYAGSLYNNKQNAPFRVLNNGTLHATGAHVTGEINARSGYIGGWNISQTRDATGQITSGYLTYGTLGSSNGFHMYAGTGGSGKFFGADSSQNWALGIGDSFGVTTSGVLYATGADISGKITAKSGKIGKFTLSSLNLVSTYIQIRDGSIQLTSAADKFNDENTPSINISAGDSENQESIKLTTGEGAFIDLDYTPALIYIGTTTYSQQGHDYLPKGTENPITKSCFAIDNSYNVFLNSIYAKDKCRIPEIDGNLIGTSRSYGDIRWGTDGLTILAGTEYEYTASWDEIVNILIPLSPVIAKT